MRHLRVFFVILVSFQWSVLSGEVLYATALDSCSVTLEVERKWKNLHVRLMNTRGGTCTLAEDAFYAFLDSAFTALARAQDTTAYASIFLGRIIEYPWISRFLADTAATDPGWDSDKGKPGDGHENTYVAAILFHDSIIAPVNDRLARICYKVSGVSVEKVLVSRGKQGHAPPWIDPNHRVPYDALLWFTLKKI